ncbi:MAG TPA: hypothetical protein VFA04_00620 [Bryobacteraceae bacterium]|jgi:hypothetical protein|nr:hypothetical protein [Bryobacteraceae bacterium]
MDPTLHAVLAVAMRWIHIASVIVLLGGFVFARFVLAGAEPAGMLQRFRPLLITVVVTVVGSGLYNYLTKENYPPQYHMWMGIKLLLVLDVLAATVLYATTSGDAGKRRRRAMHIVIVGAVIVLISGWLRYLSLSPVVKLP